MLRIFILTLFYDIILSSLYYLTPENFWVFRLFGAFCPSPTNVAKFLPWLAENYFSILIQNKQFEFICGTTSSFIIWYVNRACPKTWNINYGPSERTPINVEPSLMTSSFYELTYAIINDSQLMREACPHRGYPNLCQGKGMCGFKKCIELYIKILLELENLFSQHEYDPK